jgi:hypothetical protein
MLLLESCLQSCMTYTIAECTVNKVLMMDRRTVRNMESSMTKYIVKLVHLVGFITKKLSLTFVTLCYLFVLVLLNEVSFVPNYNVCD